MGRILNFIHEKSDGKFYCYKTRKFSLDTINNDNLNYDDKPISTFKKSVFAETDHSRKKTVSVADLLVSTKEYPIFKYFLDGSRRIYQVDDIGIGAKIFPIVAGQFVVGCCERRSRNEFKKTDLEYKIVLSLPEDFDDNDEGENFLRDYREQLNKEISTVEFIKERNIKLDKLLLYKTDGFELKDKDNCRNRAIAKIQAEMTDEEQRMVAKLCSKNKLHDEAFLIKDGSLEYNPRFSNLTELQWLALRSNYQHVVGVSKSFDPELLLDYEGDKLSRTIADLRPFERTKAYKYSTTDDINFAVWYLRLRRKEFRETHFSDIVKVEMVMLGNQLLDTDLINTISANLINEAYPVCYGADTRWANHLYPVFLTESFCKSHYMDNNIILNLF